MNTVITAVLGNLGIQALVHQLVVGACLASILEGGLLGTQGEAFLAASAPNHSPLFISAVSNLRHIYHPMPTAKLCLGQTSLH